VLDELPEDFPREALAEQGDELVRSEGCRTCRGTGYRGRAGLFELLVPNEEVRHLANEREASHRIKRAALADGMQSLRQHGWQRVLRGETSVDEVLRVTKADA
jgi:general secretion pathway protein E/type IV pilus assembly protein PilB